MAKLSAYGRTTIAHFVKEVPTDDLDKEYGITNRKLHRRLMSDGKVLVKSEWQHHGRQTTNWTVRGELKPGVTNEQWVENRIKDGWTRVD